MPSEERPAVLALYQLDADADVRDTTAEVFGKTTMVDGVRSATMNAPFESLNDDAIPVAVRESHLPDRALVGVLGTDRSRADRYRAVLSELRALKAEAAGDDPDDWNGQWSHLRTAERQLESVLILEDGPDALDRDTQEAPDE